MEQAKYNRLNTDTTRAVQCSSEVPCICSDCQGKAKCSTLQCPLGTLAKDNAAVVECACSTCSEEADLATCCDEVECPAISVAPSGSTAGAGACAARGVFSNPTCSFSCIAGYSIVGDSDTIACTADGQWPTHPTCEEIMCATIQVTASGATATTD